jgi:hypothetical protein
VYACILLLRRGTDSYFPKRVLKDSERFRIGFRPQEVKDQQCDLTCKCPITVSIAPESDCTVAPQSTRICLSRQHQKLPAKSLHQLLSAFQHDAVLQVSYLSMAFDNVLMRYQSDMLLIWILVNPRWPVLNTNKVSRQCQRRRPLRNGLHPNPVHVTIFMS